MSSSRGSTLGLALLRSSAHHLVHEAFVRDPKGRYEEADVAEHLVAFDASVPDDFDDRVRRAAEGFAAYDRSMDGPMAEAVHRALPLTRCQASESGLWRYLAVVRLPDVVRHRWEYRSFAQARRRFWTHGVRFDANALCRWWWVGELTVDRGGRGLGAGRELGAERGRGEEYTLTHAALSSAALSTHLFTRTLVAHRGTLAACVRVLADAPGAEVEMALCRLGKMASVRVLEGMSDAQLEALVQEARGAP